MLTSCQSPRLPPLAVWSDSLYLPTVSLTCLQLLLSLFLPSDVPLKSFTFSLATSSDPRASNTISPCMWLLGLHLQPHLQFKALVSQCQLPGHLCSGTPRGMTTLYTCTICGPNLLLSQPPPFLFTHPPPFQPCKPETSSSLTPSRPLHM